MRKVVRAGCLLALCLLAAAPAWAHKVNLFAYVEGGRIKGEAYFAGGDKAQACRVEALDAAGKAVGQAQTDARGEFSLALPAVAGPLKLVIHAGQGHQGDYTLTAGDLGQAEAGAGAPASPDQPALDQAALAGVSAAEMEAALGRALDKRLAPINAQLAKLASERGVGVQDVIGGLGYILGLLGLAAYLKARKG